MTMQRFVWFAALVLVVSGCSSVRNILGVASPGDPSVTLKSAETRWVLIKNPRFGDVPSEPEYVWVEEDKIPTTVRTVVLGKGSIIAPPEIVAKYGPPPGGGKISARQGVPTQPSAEAPARSAPAPAAAADGSRRAAVPATPEPRRGLVVYIDTTRIVVDLTAADGLKPGTVLSIRRDRIPIVHPVTGEVLGELDEEVGTARVTEVRDKFSVAELQGVAAGAQVQLKDRAIPK